MQMQGIIDCVAELWPGTKIVHGKARHSQSQGGVERLNRTVQEKLGKWMVDNDSVQWSVGIKFVKWQINTAYSSAVDQSPFFLLTGQKPTCGLSSLPINASLISRPRLGRGPLS